MSNESRNLNIMLNPGSIAVIGATPKKGRVGHDILKNLLKGGTFKSPYNSAFKGKIFPVNPRYKKIMGLKCYSSVLDIPSKIELAVIAVPSSYVFNVIKDCVRKKIPGAIIISAGFKEIGEKGKKLEIQISEYSRRHNLRLIGPNCLGVINTHNNMNASFAPAMPPRGEVAFVSQSGAIIDSVVDWAIENDYGFSKIISYGNKADIEIHEYLEYLGQDKDTKVITLYIEGIEQGGEFLKVAKKVNKTKPIVVLKGGKTSEGAKAISSHTGSLAGSYEVYLTAFKQAKLTVAESVEELFDFARTLCYQPAAKKNRIGIITNAGGGGVLCADACNKLGVKLARLTKKTINKLDSTKVMHPAYSKRNPLDIIGDARADRYKAAINTLLSESYINGLIVIQTLQTMTEPVKNANIVVEAHKKYPNKPVICSFVGGKYSKKGEHILKKNKIPNFDDISKAAKAMKVLVERGTII